MKQISYKNLFAHAFRTALIFVVGLLIYESILKVEKIWNKEFPNQKIYNFHKRIYLKFILIFLADVAILYSLAVLLGIEV